MDISLLELARALIVGGLLGACYFAALFWTVRRLPTSSNPALLAFSSFVFRNLAVFAGLLWLVERNWLALVAALVGFIASRQVVLYLCGPSRHANIREHAAHGND